MTPEWPTITYEDEFALLTVYGDATPVGPEWQEIPIPWRTRAWAWFCRRPLARVFWKGPARG